MTVQEHDFLFGATVRDVRVYEKGWRSMTSLVAVAMRSWFNDELLDCYDYNYIYSF